MEQVLPRRRRRWRGWEFLLIIALIAGGAYAAKRQAEKRAAQEREAEARAAQFLESLSPEVRDLVGAAPLLFLDGAVNGLQTPELTEAFVQRRLASQRLSREPDNVEALRQRMKAYETLGEWEKMRADMDHLLRLEPTDTKALYRRAWYYADAGRYREAVADLDRLLALEPYDGWSLNNRAYYLAKLGKFDKAVIDAEGAVDLMPDEPSVKDTLGYIYVGLGRYEDAVDLYTQALETQEFPEALRGRAVAWYQLGQKEKAEADLQRCDAISPDYCLHWALTPDPGNHVSGVKTQLEPEI